MGVVGLAEDIATQPSSAWQYWLNRFVNGITYQLLDVAVGVV